MGFAGTKPKGDDPTRFHPDGTIYYVDGREEKKAEARELEARRERLAATAMQGILASDEAVSPGYASKLAIEYADALIDALSKEKGTNKRLEEKRERLAATAMQGLLMNDAKCSPVFIARTAIESAEELIKQLDE